LEDSSSEERAIRTPDHGLTPVRDNDNNEAERALRPSKLHRKISGTFRSLGGAERSAHVRSYLDTTRKNGVSAMDALMRLFEGDPWMPSETT
jgi:transposase